MKRNIVKIVVFSLTFFISIIIFSIYLNQGNTDMTLEMSEATIPTIKMSYEGHLMNRMFGYKERMNESYIKDGITPIKEDRVVSFYLDHKEVEIDSIKYEIRSLDGERLIENGTLIQNQDTSNLYYSVQLKDLINSNEEYLFSIILTIDDIPYYYYTQIILEVDLHSIDKIEFVEKFHTATFEEESEFEIKQYLESNSKGDNTTLNYVNINSSYNQVKWGDLEVAKESEYNITIKELSTHTANILLEYKVTQGTGKQKKTFFVEEFYRVRYTSDRMYLLTFERTMNEVFDEQATSFSDNKIMLGITNEEVNKKESEGSNIVVFENQNRLYSYNISENKLARIFSFYDLNNLDERNVHNQNYYKILSVEDTGNVTFSVYGYMNRGRHEGEVALVVYYYDSVLNAIEELLYVPYKKSAEILKVDLEKLMYLNKQQELYFYLEGNLYCANLIEKKIDTVLSDIEEESFKVSDTNRMIVWQEGNRLYDSQTLILMNLLDGTSRRIDAPSESCIMPLGFMGEDLVYGIAQSNDIEVETTGSILFPMYILTIQNENGEILKSYQMDNIYVVESTIESNLMNLKRVVKSQNGYTTIGDDQITYNEEIDEELNKVSSVITQAYQKIVQIELINRIDTKNLLVLTPKEVLYEGNRIFELENEEREERFYVYGKNGISFISSLAGKAVQYAHEISGSVINDYGVCIYKKGSLVTRNQIMAITIHESTTVEDGLNQCINTILQYEGVSRNVDIMLQNGSTPYKILKESLPEKQILDLSGVTLDAILYYINSDKPVLASLNDGSAVLIIGFNQQNIVLMDPVKGSIYLQGLNDSRTFFEENGNRFISYIDRN